MAMYQTALLPIVELLENTDIVLKWYADDGNAVGKLRFLLRLHEALGEHGPAFVFQKTAQRFQNKNSVRALKDHFETLTARKDSPSEYISSKC